MKKFGIGHTGNKKSGCRMSSYHDGWGYHSRATVTVHTDTPSAKVTYHGAAGKRFRVIVRQKPNPIGFRAHLPGDAWR